MHSLRFRDVTISWLDHTPHASAVYASCSALLPPHATLASQAACYGLTWAGLAPADRASFGWRLRVLRPNPQLASERARKGALPGARNSSRPHPLLDAPPSQMHVCKSLCACEFDTERSHRVRAPRP